MASAAELTVQIAQLEDKLRIARQGLAKLDPKLQMNQAILARYRSEAADLPTQISTLKSQLAALRGSTSSGVIAREDRAARVQNANETNPPGEIKVLDNGRIQLPPDTDTSSNAIKSPPDYYGDFGTDDELRPYIQTQSTPPSTGPGPIDDAALRGTRQFDPNLQVVRQFDPNNQNNTFGTVPVSEDAYRGQGQIGVPSIRPGVGAASDDQGKGADVVSALNAINFADKIIAQPNILDQYASYTYTASLYLITRANASKLLNLGSRDLSGARLLVQSGGISQTTRSSYFDLDYYIDDIEMHSFIAGQGSRAAHNVKEVRIKIIEPNGISFIENIDAAVQEFVSATTPTTTYYENNGASSAGPGKKISYTSQTFLLVIRFYGYDQQGNLVRGGKKATTTDPNSFVEKFYPLRIEKFGFKVAGKAAEYDIKFKAPQHQLNGGQARASLPFNFEFSGGTVNDVLAGPATYGTLQTETESQRAETAAQARTAFAARDPRRLDLTEEQKAPPKASAIVPNKKTVRQGLMAALNEFQQELVKSGKIEFADEFNIEFALPAMAEASIVLPGVNKSTTSMSTPGTAADQKLGSKQSMDAKTQNIAATAGMQIVQFIDMVLRNSSYISDQQVLIVDNKTGRETPGPGVNLKNTAWYKIGFKAVPMMDKYDTVRNDYAYKMTYIISPYKLSQLYSPYFKFPEFNGVHKSYKYWFTGQNTSVLNYEETLNNLFFIVLSNQSQGTTSNINELLKQQPYTASGQASQGGQGRATEPGANAADQLYSAGDLKECNMTIVGDPAWLQQGEAFAIQSAKDPYYYQPFLADGTINFDSQQILFEIAFNTPRDYNLGTGLIQPSMTKNTELYPSNTENLGGATKISRIYIAKECVSNFKQGKFTQQLKGTLRVYKIPGTEPQRAADPPKATAVAAPTQSKAPPAPKTVGQLPVKQQAAIAAGTSEVLVNDQGMAFGGGGL